MIDHLFRLYSIVIKIIIFAAFEYLHCARIRVLILFRLFNPKSIVVTNIDFDYNKQPLFAPKSKKMSIISVLSIVKKFLRITAKINTIFNVKY